MKPIVVNEDAELDLQETVTWYEEQRSGLGADFLKCFKEAMTYVSRYPNLYPVIHADIRRILIRRFPYGVFYLNEPDQIVIIGIVHDKRDPRVWKSRR